MLDRPTALPYLEDTDTLPLDYRWFDALDTLIFEGLRSRSVALRSRKSGRGVRVSFDGFPMLAFWTMPGKKAPTCALSRGTAAPPGRRRGRNSPIKPTASSWPPARAAPWPTGRTPCELVFPQKRGPYNGPRFFVRRGPRPCRG
ncbi:MAG: hypothetical protein ACLRNQ_01070 [Flavonifractor plautii]